MEYIMSQYGIYSFIKVVYINNIKSMSTVSKANISWTIYLLVFFSISENK